MIRRFSLFASCIAVVALLATGCDTTPTASQTSTPTATPSNDEGGAVSSKMKIQTEAFEVVKGIQIRQIDGEEPAVVLETGETQITLTPQQAQLLGSTVSSAGYSLRPIDMREELPRYNDDPYCSPAPDYGYVTLADGSAFYVCPNPPPMPPFYEIFLDATPVKELPQDLRPVPGGAIGEPL